MVYGSNPIIKMYQRTPTLYRLSGQNRGRRPNPIRNPSLTLNFTLTLTLTLFLTVSITLNLTLNVAVTGLGRLPRFCRLNATFKAS